MASNSSTDGAEGDKEQSYKDMVVSRVDDVPDAAAVATAAVSGMAISKEESARLVRRIDCVSSQEVAREAVHNRELIFPHLQWIMPLLCITYAIQFLDKTSLAYAAVMGIRKDNNLTLSQCELSWFRSRDSPLTARPSHPPSVIAELSIRSFLRAPPTYEDSWLSSIFCWSSPYSSTAVFPLADF